MSSAPSGRAELAQRIAATWRRRVERNALKTDPTKPPAALHDVRGYTDEALEVLRGTSTAMAAKVTIKPQAQRSLAERKAAETGSTPEV